MAEDTEKKADESGPIVLLDNNMIQHFLSNETGPYLEPILKEVKDLSVRLAISQIVVYESLKAIVFNPKKSQPVLEFLETYPIRYPINEEVLVQAARVHEMYGSDKEIRKHRDKISSEDIIIGTTSMMLGAYVMTCDASDYPPPFFKEFNRQCITYEVNNRRKHLVVYMLQPDNEVIDAFLTELGQK